MSLELNLIAYARDKKNDELSMILMDVFNKHVPFDSNTRRNNRCWQVFPCRLNYSRMKNVCNSHGRKVRSYHEASSHEAPHIPRNTEFPGLDSS